MGATRSAGAFAAIKDDTAAGMLTVADDRLLSKINRSNIRSDACNLLSCWKYVRYLMMLAFGRLPGLCIF